MSRDIFVQDIPSDVVSVGQIPDEWVPRALPFGHADVVRAVRELAPNADVDDPEWMHVEMPGVAIEVNCSDESPLESFALHVRAEDRAAADDFITAFLTLLGARAFDPESDTGIFRV